MKEQIEKMACEKCLHLLACLTNSEYVPTPCPAYEDKACFSKQSEGDWEWFEEWNPSTPEHPRECDDCGWRCGECKTALADIVGGYWDDPDEKPNLNFCPDCGAKMKGDKNEQRAD